MAPNISIDQHLRSDHSRIAIDQYLDRYTTDIVFFDEIKKTFNNYVTISAMSKPSAERVAVTKLCAVTNGRVEEFEA